MVACKANYPVALQSGKSDVAYLLFVGSKKCAGEKVEVFLDDMLSFEAKVVKQESANNKGTKYGVKTGVHKLKVVHKDDIVYKKKVFLSTQEVKHINLP